MQGILLIPGCFSRKSQDTFWWVELLPVTSSGIPVVGKNLRSLALQCPWAVLHSGSNRVSVPSSNQICAQTLSWG